MAEVAVNPPETAHYDSLVNKLSVAEVDATVKVLYFDLLLWNQRSWMSNNGQEKRTSSQACWSVSEMGTSCSQRRRILASDGLWCWKKAQLASKNSFPMESVKRSNGIVSNGESTMDTLWCVKDCKLLIDVEFATVALLTTSYKLPALSMKNKNVVDTSTVMAISSLHVTMSRNVFLRW